MSKAVLVLGVGFHNNSEKEQKWIDEISERTGYETELFIWDHALKRKLHYGCLRDFFIEIVLDFKHIILNASEIKLPEADVYIGHSAGSILSLLQPNKPAIIMGSPVSVLDIISNSNEKQGAISENIINVMANIEYNKRQILNIINRHDIISYPLHLPNTGVENVYYQEKWYKPIDIFPLGAHGNYWRSKYVKKTIINKLNSWKKNT